MHASVGGSNDDVNRPDTGDSDGARLAAMDGVHDLGGLDGFGPVDASPSEPVFHEDWERRAFRVNMAVLMGLGPGGARFRHSIERMDPVHYLSSTYYEHWLTSSASLLVEAGRVSAAELAERAGGRFPVSGPDRGELPHDAVESVTTPRFAAGSRVRVRSWHPPGHTRAPRYVQGKVGVIDRVDEPANLPDVEAHGGGQVLNPTYSVRFTARDLWGDGGSDGVTVNVDLWEHYLEEDT
jgi:nitrile hydratase